MKKVTGIKSVDFKITALGHGVVNWNGSPNLTIIVDRKHENINNHSLPKLRGYSNVKEFDDNGAAKFYHHPESIDFSKSKLYISQNCIRHHLFRDCSYNLQSKQLESSALKLLSSITGLMRGYVIPKNENKRTSPLLLTDFVDQLGNGNFEQMGRSGSKKKEKTKSGVDKSNSLFSKTTFGDTKYIAYGSISVELLQFIPLCADFGRQAMIVDSNKNGEEVAKTLVEYIKSLASVEDDSKVKAVYHENYVRVGSIFNEGEQGVLLNDTAVKVLINKTIEMLLNLSIRQGKGYMYVDDVLLDYNDSNKMMRIKHSESDISEEISNNYAVYYKGV